MNDWNGSTTYAFDPLNRMVGKTDPGALNQAYAYDKASQRVNLTDPDGGIRTYAYDNDGRLTVFQDASGGLTTNQYDSDGRLATALCASGIQQRTAYDAVGQTVSMAHVSGSGSILQFQTFSCDGNGNRTAIVDLIGAWTTYLYDPKDRLEGDNSSGTNSHAYSYVYDGVDNRSACNETGNLASSTFNAAQRIVTTVENSVGTTTYVYDPNGNVIEVVNPDGSVITMSYDKENRESVHQDAASVATYTYAGDGLKKTEYVDGALTTLVWDDDDYLQGRS